MTKTKEKCMTCEVSESRSGGLKDGECPNCRDTRENKILCIHPGLSRTSLQLKRTEEILECLTRLDAIGTPVKVGDTVAFRPAYSNSLYKGKVVRLTKNRIHVSGGRGTDVKESRHVVSIEKTENTEILNILTYLKNEFPLAFNALYSEGIIG